MSGVARLLTSLVVFVALCGGITVSADVTFEGEKAKIKTVVESSIGWALEKDWDMLYSAVAHDPEFFIFHPDSASTIVGFDAFKAHVERLFKNDHFKATHFETKDLRINLSRSGEVAWYSCYLDDFGEWDGQPFGWENCRWTGVLEKRDGDWVICQMHFSFGTDQGKDKESSGDDEG